ncbi:MAG: aminopeptidase P N-terminal domain-containing protein [Pseudomonadota bacterium]
MNARARSAGAESPRVALAEYRRRRARLTALMAPGSIALVPAGSNRQRTRATDYPFRQDSDFYYLTGFEEPDAVLVLAPGRQHGEVILFCAERDAQRERWEGATLGPEQAVASLGLDDAFPSADMSDILPGLLEGRSRIYVTLGEHPEFDARLLGWVQRMRAAAGADAPPGDFSALQHLLHEQRLVKSAAELRLMQRAADISADAHARAMRACRPGMTEGELEAELVYEFMRQGGRYPAYPSIVGAGANACVLHYRGSRARLKDKDLVLIDAGCEYGNYAADITRTMPASGRFSADQQALYEVVLAAQEAAIEAVSAGADFDAPQRVARRVITEGLIELKLIKVPLAEALETHSDARFCPTRISHWLGLDVHDVGDYRVDGAWRELEAGMVLTIEPGVYVAKDEPGVAARWRGMAVRIEDDVVVEKFGRRVLSEAAPKRPADVQRMMRRKL